MKCLDQNNMDNYPPVSYLSFNAMILTKLVSYKVYSYLQSNNLYDNVHIAYRSGHNTEAARLKDVDDLFPSFKKGNMSMLALLDFLQHFTQLINLSMYTVFSLTFD